MWTKYNKINYICLTAETTPFFYQIDYWIAEMVPIYLDLGTRASEKTTLIVDML